MEATLESSWFCAIDGESIGPLRMDQVADLIGRSEGEIPLVWTEGFAEWADARSVPEFARALARREGEAVVVAASQKPTLLQRGGRELRSYLKVSAYLFVWFSAVMFYKSAVLGSLGVKFAPLGFALVKALILGKFMLVLEALKIGDRAATSWALFARVFKKALVFTLLLFLLTVLEELTVGYFHGRSPSEVMTDFAGGSFAQALAMGLLMFLVLIPYFAFQEIAQALGEGELTKLLLASHLDEAERKAP